MRVSQCQPALMQPRDRSNFGRDSREQNLAELAVSNSEDAIWRFRQVVRIIRMLQLEYDMVSFRSALQPQSPRPSCTQTQLDLSSLRIWKDLRLRVLV